MRPIRRRSLNRPKRQGCSPRSKHIADTLSDPSADIPEDPHAGWDIYSISGDEDEDEDVKARVTAKKLQAEGEEPEDDDYLEETAEEREARNYREETEEEQEAREQDEIYDRELFGYEDGDEAT